MELAIDEDYPVTIEDYFLELERRKVIFDRKELSHWLYEYACQTCEFEGIDPRKSGEDIRRKTFIKLRQTYGIANQIYQNGGKARIQFREEEIPSLVKAEHDSKTVWGTKVFFHEDGKPEWEKEDFWKEANYSLEEGEDITDPYKEKDLDETLQESCMELHLI